MKLLTLTLLTLGCAFAQAVYIEPPPALTVSGNPPSGSFPTVLAASGAQVSICSYPSCASLTQTYTDATAVTPCPLNAQSVIAGTSTCTSSADVRGNFGFWVLTGGQYQYKITLINGTVYGPYPVTMQTNNSANVQLVGPDSQPHNVQDLTNSALGAGLIVNRQSGANAVSRTVGAELNDTVKASQFATVQDAINGASGKQLVFAPGTYTCVGLTWGTSTNIQIVLQQGADITACTLPPANATHWIRDERNGLLSSKGAAFPDGVAVTASAFPGSDIGAQINAAVASLPKYTTGNGPAAYGTVVIPLGAHTFSTPIVINSPLVALDCQGGTLTYTGNGVAITFNDSPTSYSGWGGMYNCVLFGTSSATAGLMLQEVTGFSLVNSRIGSFSNGIGIYYHDANKWTEKSYLAHVLLDENKYAIKLVDDSPGYASGFSYHHWYDVNISVPVNGFGVYLAGPWINEDFQTNFFLAQGSTAIYIGGNAQILPGTRWSITGEPTAGTTAATGVKTEAGVLWALLERLWWNVYGPITNDFAANTYQATYAFTVDRGWIAGAWNGVTIGPPAGAPFTKSLTFDLSGLTGKRSLAVPDADGTIVIPTQPQTWAGNHSFNNFVFFGDPGHIGAAPYLSAAGTADSTHNYSSNYFGLNTSIWNGSAAVGKTASWRYTPESASGANPAMRFEWVIPTTTGGDKYSWIIGTNAMFQVTRTGPASAVIPVYANQAAAAAGGLVAGQFYRTGGDPDHLCIVH